MSEECDYCGHSLETYIKEVGDSIEEVFVDGVRYVHPQLITATYRTKVCSDDLRGRQVFEYLCCDGMECIANDAKGALKGLQAELKIFTKAYRKALKELGRPL